MELSKIQQTFLLTACNLKEAVFQFDITDKDFKEDYGFTKQQALEAIDDLHVQLIIMKNER